jgi:hypothetical protein
VITGFRTHPRGAQALFGVDADLVVYGKVVGGGLPIGVLGGAARYLDALDGGAWAYGDASKPRPPATFVAGTFCHHPLSMAAARAVLEHLEAAGPGLQRELTRDTALLVRRLNRWFEAERAPVRARSYGSLFRLDPAGSTGELFFLQLLLEGVFVWEGRTCFLSTAHGEAEVAFLEQAIRRAVRALRARGIWRQPAPAAERLPLSDTQRAALAGDDTQALVLRLRGPLDRDALDAAAAEVVARHPLLRATGVEGGAVRLGDAPAVEWLTARGASAPPGAALELVAALRAETRVLGPAPLFRLAAVALGEDDHLLALVGHRLATDGWSLGVVVRELGLAYGGGQLPAAPAWSEAREAVDDLWSEAPARAASFPLTRRPGPAAGAALMVQALPPSFAAAVAECARAARVGEVAAWIALVGRTLAEGCDAPAVDLAVPVAGQARLGQLGLVGPASGVTGVTVCPHTDPAHDLRAAHAALRGALRAPRRIEGAGVAFNLDRPEPAPAFAGLTLDYVSAPVTTSRYPLVINVVPLPDRLVVEWKHRLDPRRVEALADRLAVELAALARSDTTLAALEPACLPTVAASPTPEASPCP